MADKFKTANRMRALRWYIFIEAILLMFKCVLLMQIYIHFLTYTAWKAKGNILSKYIYRE